MLKIKNLIEKLKQFDEETEIKVKINDRNFYSEISAISFNTWVDNEFDDEVVLEIYDEYLAEKVSDDNEL